MRPKNLLLLFLFLFLFSFSARAENEEQPMPETTPTQTEQSSAENTQPAQDAELCICGRPIYAESGQGYSKFDCTKCRQNYLLCRCACWCGAETHTETEGEGQPLFCNGCNNRCTECTCADKEILLKREKQIAEGSLSPLGLQKPTSFAAISVVLLFILAALYFALTAQARKALPAKKEPLQNEKAKKIPEQPLPQTEGRTAPIPVDISEIPPLDAYEAAEEWISRNIRKRTDLLEELGAFRLSTGQFSELKERAGLTPNGKCPVNTDAPRKPLPQTLATRESLTQEGLSAAKTILTPEKICMAAKRGEPGYKICFFENSVRILSDEGRFSGALTKKQTAAFLRKGLCDFSDHEEKLKTPVSERFQKETFTVLMALYLTGKTRFGKAAQEKLAQHAKIPLNLFRKAMEKLEKKGLLENNGEEYRLSFKATTLLPEPGDDTVMFRTEKQRILFVNKTDCILCIHEQNDGYFILSCEKIPWNLYLGE